MSQNGQDNKCPRSSQSKIIIHFAVAAHEYSDVVGKCFLADDSFLFHLGEAGDIILELLVPPNSNMTDSRSGTSN